MQQAHRTGRHPDSRLGRPETVPFDKRALERATRSDPLDSTLPGVVVDPSLPLILTTRRERLVLKHPSEFDQRAPSEDRTLARFLVALTIAAVVVIVFAAAPSLDLRASFAESVASERVSKPPPQAQATKPLRAAKVQTPAPLLSTPAEPVKPTPAAPVQSMPAPVTATSAEAEARGLALSTFAAPNVPTKDVAAKARVERKAPASVSTRAAKRAKKRARATRNEQLRISTH